MVCPKCGAPKLTVIDSLPGHDSFIFRRRKCLECDYRFRTAEVVFTDDNSAFKYAFNEAEKARYGGKK